MSESDLPKRRGRPPGKNTGKMGQLKPPAPKAIGPSRTGKGKRRGAREWNTAVKMEPLIKRAITRGETPEKTAFFVQTVIKQAIDAGDPIVRTVYAWSYTRIIAECEEVCRTLGLEPWTAAAKTGVSLQILIDRAHEVIAREGSGISAKDLATLSRAIMDLESSLASLRAGIVAPIDHAGSAKALLDELFPEEEDLK